MTLKDLSQLYYLDKLIRRDEQRLEQLRAQLTDTTPRLTGMPGRPGASDKVGDAVPAIVDLARKIEKEREEFEKSKVELECYLRRIEDTQTRLIFLLRFVDLKSWNEVADAMGGNNTEGSVKQACYRYLKEQAKTCSECSAQV